jgi:hypothetical protein
MTRHQRRQRNACIVFATLAATYGVNSFPSFAGQTNPTNFPTTTGAYQTGEGGIDIPVPAQEKAARTIPLSAQLDARHSQERLCNGFRRSRSFCCLGVH